MAAWELGRALQRDAEFQRKATWSRNGELGSNVSSRAHCTIAVRSLNSSHSRYGNTFNLKVLGSKMIYTQDPEVGT